MSIFNLFAGEQSSPRFKYKDVKDPDMWDVEVISEAQSSLEKIGVPNIQKGSINYSSKEEKQGYAVGNVRFNVLGTDILLPFVIEDFRLKPVDVFIHNKTFRPLTPTQLGFSLRSGSSLGRPATMEESVRKQAPLYSSVYPPNYGKYLFADDGFDISVFAEKHGYGSHEALCGAVLKDKDLVAKCAISGVYPSIEKLNSVQVKEAEETVSSRADAVLIVRTGDGYKALSVSTSGERARSMDMDETILREALSSHLNDADAAAGKIIMDGQYSVMRPGGEPALYGEDIKKVKRSILKPVSEYVPSIVSTLINGKLERGMMIGKHLAPDLTPTGNVVFSNDNYYAIQPEIYGRIVEAPAHVCDTAHLEPKPDTTVFIVYERNVEDSVTRRVVDKEYFAYGPVHVMSVSKRPDRRIAMELTVSDDMGSIRNIIVTRGLNTFINKGGNILTPVNVKFVPTKHKFVAPSSDQETETKLAIFFENPVLNIDNYGGRFSFTGKTADSFREYVKRNGIDKIAFRDPSNYTYDESLVALRTLGISKVAAKEALDKTADGTVTIHNAQEIPDAKEPLQFDKISIDFDPKAIAFAATVISDAIQKVADGEYVKEAQIDKKVTADKALSLGLINPKNVSLFLDGIDELDGIVSYLASLLIASRIGLPVEEGGVKDALFSVAGVIDQLRTIRSAYQSKQ